MEEQKNIVIPLTEESESVLRDIIKKYGLEENQEEFFTKIKEHKLFNETIIIRLTRDLMSEKIPTHAFLDALKKDLGITVEKTKNIAKDIINNLMPLLKKFTEEELKNYKAPVKPSTLKPSEENVNTVEKFILEKIKQKKSSEEDMSLSTIKKPEIKDVEKNADILKIRGKRGSDTYREPVE